MRNQLLVTGIVFLVATGCVTDEIAQAQLDDDEWSGSETDQEFKTATVQPFAINCWETLSGSLVCKQQLQTSPHESAPGPMFPFDNTTVTLDDSSLGITIAGDPGGLTGYQSYSFDLLKQVDGEFQQLESINHAPLTGCIYPNCPSVPSRYLGDFFHVQGSGSYRIGVRITSDATNTYFVTSDFDVVAPSEVCGDGIDNDGDGEIDCNDVECTCSPSFCKFTCNSLQGLPCSPVGSTKMCKTSTATCANCFCLSSGHWACLADF